MFQTTISKHSPSEAQKPLFLVVDFVLVLVFFLTSSLPVLCLQADWKVVGPDQIWLHLLPVPQSQQERFVQLGAAAGTGWVVLAHSKQLWGDVP